MTFPISDQGDWRLRRLGELVTIDKGHVVQTQPFASAETVPYIGADSFGGNYSQFTASPTAVFCEPTDVLMLWDGERSGLCASGLIGAIGSTVARLRPKSGIDGRFLYHQLSSHFSWIQARRTGTGIPHVPKDIALILTIPIPNSQIAQSRIAAVLDTVDAAITQTEAIIAKLKQVRAGLLHDLLTRGLDENGQLRPPPAEAPHLYRDSPLGKIPREWRIMAIEHATEKVQDGTHFSPKSTSGPRRYLTSKNVRFGFLDLSDCGWISEEEHREIFRRCDVRWNDILLTKDGVNTGNAALNHLLEEFSLLSSVALIRCRPDYSDCYFLLNYLLSPIGQRRLKDLMSGNAITRLTLQKIKAFLCPIPSFDEQQGIAIYLKQCSDAIQGLEREKIKLGRLKSALMSDLLTGCVRVPADIFKENL